YPSIDRIQALASLSRNTVIKYVGTLGKDGWVTEEKGKGRASNSYSVTIPQKTIDELMARYSGSPRAPQDDSDEASSGSSHAPQNGSGSRREPQTNGVVVHHVHHKARSGSNGGRSGSRRAPDLLDTTQNHTPGTRATLTRLPEDWLTPDRRDYAAKQ